MSQLTEQQQTFLREVARQAVAATDLPVEADQVVLALERTVTWQWVHFSSSRFLIGWEQGWLENPLIDLMSPSRVSVRVN